VGEGQPRESEEDELAAVIAALGDIEAEAAEIVAAARAESVRVGAEADRRIEHLRARLPERTATSRAEAELAQDRRADAELADVRAQSEQRVSELERRADEQLPSLVDAAVASIWTLVDATEVDRS
jgi:hypothetical protein